MPEVGQAVSHYRIVEKIGQGGMGEVYLADDMTLDRKVALKFLPEAFASDPERMARFEREAKLLASLNHPNIAGIHGLEQAEENRFLVLEYVEGETLQARLRKGALPLDDALALCRQITEGLEAAHDKGVIHRDLKPANVMITAEEKVKILDFGLAKALADETQRVDPADSPTITEAMTQPGVVLGTAAYMSPEQAKGKTVDKRADIWAFGCILYECLTGKKAFEGETVTETLAAVIRGEPDWQALPPTTPQNVRFVLRRCLEKERNRRFRDAADVKIEIEEARDIIGAEIPVKKRRSWLSWSLAIICLIAALVLGILYFRQISAVVPMTRLEVVTPPTSDLTSFAISPDGRRLVFTASSEGQQRLWVRPLDQTTAQPFVGTEGALFPFWSPDSGSIGFFADSKLKRIDVESGQIQVLAVVTYRGYGGTWNRDGVIVFAPSYETPLYRIPARGGDPVAITTLDPPHQSGHTNPQFLPDGRHLLYNTFGEDQGIYLTSMDSAETMRVSISDSPVSYAPPGYLLFIHQDTLFAQSFDTTHGNLTGDQVLIADSVSIDPSFWAGSAFSVSEKGRMLAYRTGSETSQRRLVWLDREGKELGTVGAVDENYLADPKLSPDGQYVAVDRSIQGNTDIWLIDIARGVPSKFTLDKGADTWPVWSPDGSRIVFCSDRTGIYELYQKNVRGVGDEEVLYSTSLHKYPYDFSPDGRFLLYAQIDPQTDRDIWVLPLFDEEDSYPFVNKEFHERNGYFSPDGRCVAYQSNESGQHEVYIQSFPTSDEKFQISNGGGTQPQWHPNGKELFYITSDGVMMAVPINLIGERLNPGIPTPLFKTRIPGEGYMDILGVQYAVSGDGQRFLINTTVDNPIPSPITVITNWTKLLEK
jgi:serine/threonine protein kinase